MASSSKKIVLKTSDSQIFEVDEEVAMESQTIKHLVEDDCAQATIPLPNVTGNVMAKVIEYCKRHVASSKSSEGDLKAFDNDFINVDQATLFDIILAANYLNVKNLLDLSCQAVADLIKDKDVEEIRRIFNIKNDFTPEEEAEIRKENAWAFEK